jgi:hypothetical protein
MSDPRAASGTRTLLRLLPSHRAQGLAPLRGVSAVPGSLAVTGGEYRAQERIHRNMADFRLLAIPASRGRVADPDPNWAGFLGISSALRLGNPL